MSDLGATDPAGAPFAAVVLAGGASRRMGRDKATVAVEGVALGRRVRDALREVGADPVVAVGGAEPRFRVWGYRWLEDQWPGAGPLGGAVTGLEHLAASGSTDELAVALLAVDLPWLRGDRLSALARRLLAGGSDAVVPRVGGRAQVLAAVYRLGARVGLRAAFLAGERSLVAAVEGLRVEVVDLDGDAGWLRDVDTPDELPDP